MPLLRLRSSADPLQELLQVYRERKDLQEVFWEGETGDYRRLIDWAYGVSHGKFVDSSYARLRPHAHWFKTHFTGASATPPVPWVYLQGVAEHTANPIGSILEMNRAGDRDDISQHLVTLSLLVIEFGLREIVELGTRMGSSTLVLLEAARMVGGHVLSVDVDECREAKQLVRASGLGHLWRFIQGNDVEIAGAELPRIIDLLFIDTNHIYEHTLAELRKFVPHMRPGGWIAFHDYISFAGVTRAVGEFVASLPHPPRLYPYVHQNGLALVKLEGSNP